MKTNLRILHLEDLATDAKLVERELRKGDFTFEKLVVDNRRDFENALIQFPPDIILSDHSLPSFNSQEALQIVKRAGLEIPFILITSTVSEEFAVTVMQQGADDYILKDKMSRLPSSILQAIAKYEGRAAMKKAEQQLQETHERLLFHLENSPLGYIEWDGGYEIKTWSKQAEEIFGWTMEEFNQKGREGLNQVYIEDRPGVSRLIDQLLNGVISRNNILCRYYTKTGKIIWCESFNSVLKNKEGKVATIMSLVQDITDRKQSEQALINNEFRFREFFQTAPEALLVVDTNSGFFVDYNDNALNLLRCSGTELLQKNPAQISPEFQPDGSRSAEKMMTHIRRTIRGEKPIFNWIHLDSTGKEISCEVRLNLLTNAGQRLIRASVLDITERVLLETKLQEEKTKKQLEITQAIITGQERERTVLGQELHDNINQILATSKLYMDFSISAEKVRKDVMKQSRDMLITGMEEIRKLSKSLLPPSLGEVSLQAAIDELIENIDKVHKIHIIKEWQVPDEAALQENLKLTVFRIVQEQLNNVLKYAKAKNAVISLKLQESQLYLVVKDNGVGFDTALKRRGVGLKNIISRASIFDGEVDVHSKPGKGCELSVKFHIK